MPRVDDVSHRSHDGVDTIRNMVTAAFMMNAELHLAGWVRMR